MQIGEKLKEARKNANLTQEDVADELKVSRQTISNWENEKSYPDIISVIALSDLYGVSLDTLLKGDPVMIEHLNESTNVVLSNKKLIRMMLVNVLLVIGLVILVSLLPHNKHLQVGVFCLMIVSTSLLVVEIIKKI